MGRLNTMTDHLANSTLISGVTCGVANEVQAIAGNLFNETRSYNSLFQLTQITVPGALNLQYAYSPTFNNGKIASQTDVISGEQVVFTYDALNRLATAQTVTNPNVTQWGQSYNYDGFGNLTDQNVIKGSAPSMHVTYNASTNRQTGDVADANGDLGSGNVYDIANRLVTPSGTTVQYAYAGDNKRVWRGNTANGNGELDFWSPTGQKLATFTVGDVFGFTLATADVYFGSRLIAKSTNLVTLTSVATDRLGSIGKFYPYGQERPSATQNDTEKFTGYYRDAATGLDYAVNRYEQPGVGRFMTSDPASSSAKGSDPGTWNRYAYVTGDPVNNTDPTGLYRWDWGDGSVDDGSDFGWGGGMMSMAVQAAEALLSNRQDERDYCASQGLVFSLMDGGVGDCGPPLQTVAYAPQCPLVAPSGDYTLDPGSYNPIHAIFAPAMAAALGQAFASLNAQGIVPMITSGFRTTAENSSAGGRPASNHLVGWAVDLNANDPNFEKIKQAMLDAGLTWGGNFSDSPDPVHFQLAAGHNPTPAQIAACQGEHPGGR